MSTRPGTEIQMHSVEDNSDIQQAAINAQQRRDQQKQLKLVKILYRYVRRFRGRFCFLASITFGQLEHDYYELLLWNISLILFGLSSILNPLLIILLKKDFRIACCCFDTN